MSRMLRPFQYVLPAVPAGSNVIALPILSKGLFLRADICSSGSTDYTWGISMSPHAANRLAGGTPAISTIRPGDAALTTIALPGILPAYSSVDLAAFDSVFNLFSPRTVVGGGVDNSYISGGPGLPFSSIGLDSNTPQGQGDNLFLYLTCAVIRTFFLRMYIDQ